MKKILSIGLLALLMGFAGCEVEEKVLDEVSGDDALNDPGAPVQILASVYYNVRRLMRQEGAWGLNQHSSDETLGPTRGSDWDDNGLWRVLHTHDWDPFHDNIQNAWNDISQGSSRATFAMELIRDAEQTDANRILLAEARFLRAFFEWHFIDMFGQLPIREEGERDFRTPAEVLTRAQGYDRIEGELEEIIPELADFNPTLYGRVSKQAAQTLLGMLKLNKRVYAGEDANYQEAVDLFTEVIESGFYRLSDDYFRIFDNDNTATNGNGEAIFVAEFSNSEDFGVSNHLFVNQTLHYNQRWGNDFSAWNGFTTISDFYNTFDENDPRRYDDSEMINGIARGFLEGQQRDSVGNFILERGSQDIKVADPNDARAPLLNYTVDVQLSGNSESAGVRVVKYQPDISTGNQNWANYDYIIFRLSDVYLLRAEALLRASGDAGTAKADVDMVRAARGIGPMPANPTLDDLLVERGHELYWEGHRRRDLVRFGKFNDEWSLKGQTDPAKQIFPIPQEAVDVNPNLDQNPGY